MILAAFVLNTENIVALVCFPVALYLLHRWGKKDQTPPRIEWPRAEDYDIASGKYMNRERER